MRTKDYNEGGYGFTAEERRCLGEKLEDENKKLREALTEIRDRALALSKRYGMDKSPIEDSFESLAFVAQNALNLRK